MFVCLLLSIRQVLIRSSAEFSELKTNMPHAFGRHSQSAVFERVPHIEAVSPIAVAKARLISTSSQSPSDPNHLRGNERKKGEEGRGGEGGKGENEPAGMTFKQHLCPPVKMCSK